MKRLSSITRRRWIMAIFTAFGVLFVFGLVLSHWQNASGNPSTQAFSTVPQNPDESFVQGLRTALQNNQLSPADRELLQNKLALNENLLAQRNAVPATSSSGTPHLIPTVPLPTVPSVQPIIMPTDDEKIIEGSEGLVKPDEASVQNLWQGQRDGIYYQVLAGATATDPSQGWLLVIANQPDQNKINHQVYTAPGTSGALRILSVQGNQVRLQTSAGGTLSFDLSTRLFQP